MRTYKMQIAYDGTRYQGWQRQKLTACTIQQILEDTLKELLGYPVELDGSGRTDAGVHAKGQWASMQVAGKLPKDFLQQWNEKLPEDIQVQSLTLTRSGFHARYRAVGKRYSYRIDTREVPSVFMRKYACHYERPLDLVAIRRVAKVLEGTHDFTAFTDDKTTKSKVRTIYQIAVQAEEDRITLSFYGTGFLYHMVRILVGTLLCVGEGSLTEEAVIEALKHPSQGRIGFVAPAKGLCLEEVYYKE